MDLQNHRQNPNETTLNRLAVEGETALLLEI